MHDNQISPQMRVVQRTPPGSTCAIVFGTGMGPVTEMEPGSVKGVHLVVDDIEDSRIALIERDVEISTAEDLGDGLMNAWFSDPDGNLWTLQQWPTSSFGLCWSIPMTTSLDSSERPFGRPSSERFTDRPPAGGLPELGGTVRVFGEITAPSVRAHG